MKKLFLLLLLSFNVNAVCNEQYYNNTFLGCKIEKGDKILNTKWLSPVINIYSGNIYQGVSYFQVDSSGNYEGKTLIRRPTEECVRYNPNGWTGKLYKIESNTYAAWNTGTYDAFYLINMSTDGLVGKSFLIGGTGIINLSEINDFYKKPKTFDFNNILKVFNQFLCEDK